MREGEGICHEKSMASIRISPIEERARALMLLNCELLLLDPTVFINAAVPFSHTALP